MINLQRGIILVCEGVAKLPLTSRQYQRIVPEARRHQLSALVGGIQVVLRLVHLFVFSAEADLLLLPFQYLDLHNASRLVRSNT